MKKCPYCAEQIQDDAIKCKHCGSILADAPIPGSGKSGRKGDPLDYPDIRRLNSQEGTDKYRLPTAAEWEYAARSGTTTAYSFGNSESELEAYGWYDGNSGGRTHPVGQKRPNAWGLYDIHGNVWEWVQDQIGSERVGRGGSWRLDAVYCSSDFRGWNDPGFRLARTK